MGSGGIASSWDGTLSESEFRAATAFADQWRIAESLLSSDGFMSLENVCLARSVEDPADGDATAEESGPCERYEMVDDATLVRKGGRQIQMDFYHLGGTSILEETLTRATSLRN